jgi:hypothetical protein
MAFIDKLLEGGLPYGMEIEQPKGDDKINRLIFDNDMQSIVESLVMGTMGGGAGKGADVIRKIMAKNAKSLRNLKSGTVKGQQTLKPQDRQHLSEEWRKWEELTKEISTKNPDTLDGAASFGITMALGPILAAMTQAPRYKGYGKLGGLPNIGLPPKQR